MHRNIFLLIILLFFSFRGICQDKEINIDQLKSQLQSTLDSLASYTDIPGITFCLAFKDGKKISLASGFADHEYKIKMPVDAVMFTGSVGKTFVAATVLKMVEHKKLQLEDKVSQFFKNEKWFFNLPNATEITIRMLLNHTSGIPEYVYNKEIWETLKAYPDKIWTGEERLYYSSILPAVNPPGKAWSYADANYILLGLIIEKIEGKSFYELADEWFISPLKLSNTKPAIHRQIKGLVSGYTGMTEEMFLPEKMVSDGKYAFNPQLEWTGGGFVTTVSDLCIWSIELYGGEVLPGELKSEMLSSSGFQTTLVENAGYGLGVFIGKTNNITYFGHTGFVPGYRTVMEYLPEYKIALAMQVNTDKFSPGKHPVLDLNVLKSLIINYISKN